MRDVKPSPFTLHPSPFSLFPFISDIPSGMAKANVSLSEVHRSVNVPKSVSLWKRMFAFLGPAYLISVGYMDPGNWATDLEGGARFGYTLIWVLLLSNGMAVLLQTLSARLGIVTGRDLAQACRDHYSKRVTFFLWLLSEIAIAACDLAEVLGTAIGINLLFGIPLLWAVVITTLDTFIFLWIQHLGMRKFEAFILSLITIIALCFLFELVLSKPDWQQIPGGFLPSVPPGALYVIIGIIGATVMPHNLYLHSALVQTRAYDSTVQGKRQACKFNLIDSTVALNAALLVNAAILILAASTFYSKNLIVTELQQAHQMLAPLLGSAAAGVAFAIALLAAGQASTITGTLAGQIVMEGFLHFKIRPFLRRTITRLIAVLPAMVVIFLTGNSGTYHLLILSQVILSLQLPFAIVPLIHFTSDKKTMGEFANALWVKILSWSVAIVIIALNMRLVYETLHSWISTSPVPMLVYVIVVPLMAAIFGFLLYITIKPFIHLPEHDRTPAWKKFSHFMLAQDELMELEVLHYKRVGVSVEHIEDDRKVLAHAYTLARHHDAKLCLFHVVEGVGGVVFGSEAFDREARDDEEYLVKLAQSISNRGVEVETFLGYGSVPKEIVRLSREAEIDVLVMGSHGHRGMSDLFFGSTISPVRHELQIPIVIVR
jgi:manganese transport protein